MTLSGQEKADVQFQMALRMSRVMFIRKLPASPPMPAQITLKTSLLLDLLPIRSAMPSPTTLLTKPKVTPAPSDRGRKQNTKELA
jgi:hypothetical protein